MAPSSQTPTPCVPRSRDVLTGSSGSDWFIISNGDEITDLGKYKKLLLGSNWYGDDYVTFVS